MWGRRSIRGWYPLRTIAPYSDIPLVSRTWSSTGVVTGQGGLTWVTQVVGAQSRGSWGVSTSGPLPPGSPAGWSTLLKWIPVGTLVGGLSWAVHSRGSSAKVLRHKGSFTQVKLPSGKETWLSNSIGATLVGLDNQVCLHLRSTAGDSWREGWRPKVRGTAMNPIDHPHGGGQGKTSGGRPGVTPWGRLTRGVKTKRHFH